MRLIFSISVLLWHVSTSVVAPNRNITKVESATAPPATSPSCGQQPLHHPGRSSRLVGIAPPSLSRARVHREHGQRRAAAQRAKSTRCWRSLPPSSAAAATAAVDHVKKKSAARPKLGPDSARRSAPAREAHKEHKSTTLRELDACTPRGAHGR